MTPDKIIVTIVGVIGAIGTYWFFFMKKEENIVASDTIDIVVDGGYNPDFITVSLDKKTTLRFIRKDSNSCLEDIVLSDFKVKKFLPINTLVEIAINPQKKGTFSFTCGMGMFHGKIIVK